MSDLKEHLTFTPIESIKPGVDRVRKGFHSTQRSHSLQFRLNQLRNFYFALSDNIDALSDALLADFRRSVVETKFLEIGGGLKQVLHMMSKLEEFAKPEKVIDIPSTMQNQPVFIEKIPLGVILIISPFNFPLILSIGAIAGAIAAGNAIVFKPSESTPRCSEIFTKILSDALDPDFFFAVNGGIEETTELLNQKFDKIMYTGNARVGKIIAQKAAETLTPVILELGGKSPVIVLDDIEPEKIPMIARRIAWGRFMNCGQTCIAVDYVLAPESIKDALVKEMVRIIKEEFYPQVKSGHADYTHIINQRAFNRITGMIDNSKGNIAVGGDRDENTCYIHPTIIDNIDWDDSTMEDEIFGPLLPVISYTDLKKEIKELTSRHDCPLNQYIFTNNPNRSENKDLDFTLKSVRSGAAMVNDVVMTVTLSNAPFGGVGQSGYGSYHGKFSYRAFSHERTFIEETLATDDHLSWRYPSVTAEKEKLTAKDIPNDMVIPSESVWFKRYDDVPPAPRNDKKSGANSWNDFISRLFK